MEVGTQGAQPHLGVFNPGYFQVDCTVENTQPIGSVRANLDLVSEPDPVSKIGDGKFIPQKNQSLDKRVDALESAMVGVVDGIAGLRTDMRDGFAKISPK